MKVLFVCLGNICRSPTAHAIFRDICQKAHFDCEIDSAGTSAEHEGETPDPRAVKAAVGISFAGIRSRAICAADFAYFDYILAMDQQNLANLQRICPEQYRHKIRLVLSFHSDYPKWSAVPDPYYGGAKDFQWVCELLQDASRNLLQELQRQTAKLSR